MSGHAAPSLVCLGNLTLDDIVLADGAARPLCVGGDALYGVLAARLWTDAEMVAPVGCDQPPRLRMLIDRIGLSQAGLPERPCATLRNHIVYETPDRRVVSELSPAADFESLSPRCADVPAAYWNARAFMILAMTLDAQRDLVRGLRARTGAIIALDPQEEYISGNEQAILELVSQVDLFMPSLDEVRRLLGHEDARAAARHFAALGPGIVVIKMGARGSLVHDASSGRDIVTPAYPIEAVDTTGGGDAYCSAFIASLLLDPGDLAKAAATAAVGASFAVADHGIDGLLTASRRRAAERLQGWDALYPGGMPP